MESNENVVAVPLTQSGGASTVSMNEDTAAEKSLDESQRTPAKSSRASSDVWHFIERFERESDGQKLCRCKPCASVGIEKLWKSANTHTFRGHLQKKHGDIYAFKKPDSIRKRKCEYENEDINHVPMEKLRSLILASSVSPTLVELPEFFEFCSSLNASFRLPTSETVHEWLLENNSAYERDHHTLEALQEEWNSVSRKLSRAELKLSQTLSGTEQKKDLHDEVMRLSAYRTSINHRIAALQNAESGHQQKMA